MLPMPPTPQQPTSPQSTPPVLEAVTQDGYIVKITFHPFVTDQGLPAVIREHRVIGKLPFLGVPPQPIPVLQSLLAQAPVPAPAQASLHIPVQTQTQPAPVPPQVEDPVDEPDVSPPPLTLIRPPVIVPNPFYRAPGSSSLQ